MGIDKKVLDEAAARLLRSLGGLGGQADVGEYAELCLSLLLLRIYYAFDKDDEDQAREREEAKSKVPQGQGFISPHITKYEEDPQ